MNKEYICYSCGVSFIGPVNPEDVVCPECHSWNCEIACILSVDKLEKGGL